MRYARAVLSCLPPLQSTKPWHLRCGSAQLLDHRAIGPCPFLAPSWFLSRCLMCLSFADFVAQKLKLFQKGSFSMTCQSCNYELNKLRKSSCRFCKHKARSMMIHPWHAGWKVKYRWETTSLQEVFRQIVIQLYIDFMVCAFLWPCCASLCHFTLDCAILLEDRVDHGQIWVDVFLSTHLEGCCIEAGSGCMSGVLSWTLLSHVLIPVYTFVTYI